MGRGYTASDESRACIARRPTKGIGTATHKPSNVNAPGRRPHSWGADMPHAMNTALHPAPIHPTGQNKYIIPGAMVEHTTSRHVRITNKVS